MILRLVLADSKILTGRQDALITFVLLDKIKVCVVQSPPVLRSPGETIQPVSSPVVTFRLPSSIIWPPQSRFDREFPRGLTRHIKRSSDASMAFPHLDLFASKLTYSRHHGELPE